MESTIGPEGNLLRAAPESCRQIVIPDPVLTNEEVAKLRHVEHPWFRSVTLPMLYPVAEGAAGLERALEALQARASEAIADGHNIVILSDRGVTPRAGRHPEPAGHRRRPPPPGAPGRAARAAASSSRRATPARSTTCACSSATAPAP